MSTRHKFNAKKTIRDGLKFDSNKEAEYYDTLKEKVENGEVLFFLRQVPIDLPGNIRYYCDFLVFNVDHTCDFIDVKGYKTPVYKIKKKQIESIYPFKIMEV